jgi:hypothetical protein
VLPLDGFSLSLMFEHFSKICRENLFHQDLTIITGTQLEQLRSFVIVSSWIIIRMRNVSDTLCAETQNTQCVFNSVVPNIVPFMR